jgi:single-stranded DNA-binding protein
MNHVLLVGRLEQDPEPRPRAGGEDCMLHLAVDRLGPTGIAEPGVTYLEVRVPWPRSRACSDLRKGTLVAVSGMVERNDWHESGRWQRRHEIVADWVETP